MLRILKQFLPLIVILIVLASIMQVFATTEKSSSEPKLSFWDRVLIAVGLREKPTAEETRQFEYIPGRLQERQFTLPAGTFGEPQPEAGRPLDETTSDQTPASPPASPNRGESPAGFQNLPPLPPLPPSRPSALGVKTTSDVVKTVQPPKPPIPPVTPQALGAKTTNTISNFFGSIWKSIIGDLDFFKPKPPKPPIPPALPRTLGVQDQRPPLPPLPASTQRGEPPIPPREP